MAVGGYAAPNSVIIWDAATGEELLSVEKHMEFCEGLPFVAVDKLAWSPDSTRLATAAFYASSSVDDDCGATVVVSDATTGETLLTQSGHGSSILSLDWSPDGATILTGHADGTATLWDADTGAEHLTLTGHTGPVFDAAWSPDSRRIATASADGTVWLWDAETGVEQITLDRPCWPRPIG